MNNDNNSSSNNLDQPSTNLVNRPESPQEERKSNNWHFSAAITAIVLVALLLSVTVYLSLTPRQTTVNVGMPQSPSPTPSTISSTAAQIPPLYPAVQWESTESGKLVFRTRQNELIELEGYRIESVLLKTYPQDFIDYYKRELNIGGWIETAMAGSGISGDFYFYEKGGRYINFGVFIARDNSGKILGEYWAFVEHD